MKKCILLFMLIVLALPAFSQDDEETLFHGKITHGGFGGPVIKFTQVRNEFGVLVGGRGGWIINHCVAIGGGGYGLVSEIRGTDPETKDLYLGMGYGGFEIEFIHRSSRLLHSAMTMLIGAGGAGYTKHYGDRWNSGDDENGHGHWDSFFIAEPGIQMELNVTRCFRIDAGVSYRFVSGIDKYDLTDSNVSGPSAVFTFKFGKF
jgi:hypothetical protein